MSSLYSRFSLVSLLLVLISFSSGYSTRGVQANTNAITGTVHGLDGPISGAHVRVRAAQDLTLTNSHGEFTINGLTPGVEIEPDRLVGRLLRRQPAGYAACQRNNFQSTHISHYGQGNLYLGFTYTGNFRKSLR